MNKKQYFFSFVLATMSFIAARSLQKVGVENYYIKKASNFQKEDGYFDLQHPNSVATLPMGVQPFSDVTLLDSTHLVGLNQENGALYMYDLEAKSVSPFLPWDFGAKICNISNIDSTLLLVDDAKHIHFLSAPYDSSSLKTLNLENEQFEASSMCVHKETNRLFLIASNEEHVEGYSNSSVYAYNLNQRKLNAQPLFSISAEDIEAFAIKNNLIVPQSDLSIADDTLESMNFTPSAIAVHPKTNEIYILSSADHSLVVFNQFGEIVNFTSLDKATFTNPSAMTFKKNGDLVITDGNLMNPTVIQVKWNKLFQSKSGHGLIFGR
ncbi:MAG: hypothetical protein ACKOXP_07930 [Flavobacteriales bacterium]